MAKQDIAAQVSDILNEYLEGKSLEIYRIVYKKEGRDWILRVFLDKTMDAENEYVSIEECEDVTRFLSDKLDEMDLIDRSYNLEVSSPGLDRELIRESDYVRFAGRAVEVRTYEPINGKKYIEGNLAGRDGDIVIIESDDERLEIPIQKISKINLAVIF